MAWIKGTSTMMAKPIVAGLCGCGRSPTGKCVGWHALNEQEYKLKRDEYDLLKYREEAEQLWFDGGSCTGGTPE